MKCKVTWSDQVERYVRSKAPEPRRALWQAIKSLADWTGKEDLPHIRRLEDELVGYLRLRAGKDRIIFRETFFEGERTVACLFADPRSTVYETFIELFIDELGTSK